MQFYDLKNLPHFPKEKVFRYSRMKGFIVLVIFSSLSIGFLYVGRSGGFITKDISLPSFIAYWISFWIGLFALIALSIVKARFLPSNWIIRYGDDRVLIKFRSYLNYKFDKNDIQAVAVNVKDIEWVRRFDETVDISLGDSGSYRKFRYLDFKLKDVDVSQLAEKIKEEVSRSPEGRKARSKNNHYPVRIVDNEIIRVECSGVVPNTKKALKIFKGKLAVEQELKYKVNNDLLMKLNNAEKREEILQVALAGQKLDAIKMSKICFGFNTADAKSYVDELMGISKKKKA